MGEKNLTLVCEGQVHTVEYMHKNRVYPKTVVFDCSKFKEIAPYLGKSDDILAVINSATDFSLSMIYALLRDLGNIESKVASITILSNIDLGKILTPYYLYKGDLFYGDVSEIVKGKKVEKESNDVLDDSKKQKKSFKHILGKKAKEKDVVSVDAKVLKVNEVMSKFLTYSSPCKMVIHGITKREHKVYSDEFASKLIDIDLFE